MSSNVGDIIDWFHRIPARTGSHDFIDLLEEASCTALGMSKSEAERYAIGNYNRVWSKITQDLSIRSKLGLTVAISLSEDTKKCTWLCHQPRKIKRMARFWAKHQARPHILSMIDSLSWREYEALGCVIATLCGAQHVVLTPPGNECGIDFFAVMKFHSTNHIFGGTSSKIRVIGQCKKYDTKVQVDKIRAFSDTIEDVKRSEKKVSKLIPNWFHTNHGPIVGWIVSHKGFQSGAQSRAKNHGHLISDSLDLAELSSLSRHLNEDTPPDNRAILLKEMVSHFLEETESD